MSGKGGNRGRSASQGGKSAGKNARDQAVHRNPDIGGIFRRESHIKKPRHRSIVFVFLSWALRSRK